MKKILQTNYADGWLAGGELGWTVSRGTLVVWEGVAKGDVLVVARIPLSTVVAV